MQYVPLDNLYQLSEEIKIRVIVANIASYLREIGWVIWRRLTGASYADYYAKRMDSIVRRNPNWGLNNDRRFQLEFARNHGLSRGAMMLDYGCGALAAGMLFIDYLDVGCYIGADISAGVIDEGHRRLADSGLSGKGAQLQLIRGTSLEQLRNERFDFVWAQSVLTHMPPEDVRSLFVEVGSLLRSDGVFFATFSRDDKVHEHQFKDWYYTREHMRSTAEDTGYDLEFVDTWRHPHDPEGRVDTMMKLTRPRV